MKIGILGGTFDPVHRGHVALAKAALRQLKLDRVYLVLSPRSPFKLEQKLSTLSTRRLMLSAVIKGQRKLAIGDWELKRKGPSYTVSTLSAYKKMHPSHELFLIVGSDVLATFDRWKNPDQILKMASLVVGRRPGSTVKMGGVEGRVTFLKGTFPEISSTAIREKISAGGRAIGLPAQVARIIKTRRLFQIAGIP